MKYICCILILVAILGLLASLLQDYWSFRYPLYYVIVFLLASVIITPSVYKPKNSDYLVNIYIAQNVVPIFAKSGFAILILSLVYQEIIAY